tara:strand:+ start:88 stop:405 length:318 start_codon:yes stop_codon:yes gene_type:complete
MRKILLILLISFFSEGEIENKTVLKSFNEGCVNEVVPQFDEISAGFQFEYCGCATHSVANQFTLYELSLLSMEMLNASKSKQNEIIASNEKFVEIASACVLKTLQ